MSWIVSLEEHGHITESIIHFNEATNALEEGIPNVKVSRLFSDALNKIQTEWSLHQDEQSGVTKAFQTMILMSMEGTAGIELLKSDELRNFVLFDPPIMNHDILRRNHYRPDQELDSKLVKKASGAHHSLVNAYNRYFSQKTDEIKKSLLKKTAELLYVVRSNIQHSEKTSYGPDLRKIERDKEVCKVVIPLQQLLLNVLFDYPDRKLIVYGTLAPGKVNHDIISEIQGTWEDCNLNGIVIDKNGLPLFVWQPSKPPIKAQLFTSVSLPNWWDRLDQFEGSNYKRILVPVSKNDGMAVANCYVAAQNLEARRWRH